MSNDSSDSEYGKLSNLATNVISSFPLEYGIVFRHARSLVDTNLLPENIYEVMQNILCIYNYFVLVGGVTSPITSH